MVTAIMVASLAYQPASASNGWPDERIAGPFSCHANFPLQPYSRLLQDMSILQRDLVWALGIQPTNETIHLFLFDRESVYKGYIRQHFPNVPYRRALFIKDRGPGMVFAHRNSEFEVDLRHESTHALLHASLPVVPLWLDEGLAEYFEVSADKRPGGHPHLAKVRWGVRFGKVSRIERLEQIQDLKQMRQDEYRQAWAWVHFMLHGPQVARDELHGYLGDIQSHSPPGMLSRRLRRRLPDLHRQFADHFKQWRP